MPGDAPPSLPPSDADLAATTTFDYEHPGVRAFAEDAVVGARDEAERAGRLFAAVREAVRYSPYALRREREAFTASATLTGGPNWCIPKSILLAASARAVGIPARLGFADVRNHLSSERLTAAMGSDLFVFHGYAALHVGGEWRKVSPAFNAELCARFGTPPLEFDGRSDALMHAYTGDGRRHMEYVTDHGLYSDVPFDEMWAAFRANYDVDALVVADGADDAAFAEPPA